MAPVSRGDGYDRDNLLRAQAMLKAAGWHYRDGALRNAKGSRKTAETAIELSLDLDGSGTLKLSAGRKRHVLIRAI